MAYKMIYNKYTRLSFLIKRVGIVYGWESWGVKKYIDSTLFLSGLTETVVIPYSIEKKKR